MSRSTSFTTLSAAAALFCLATPVCSQNLPPDRPTEEQLATDNVLFITLAKKALKWEEPAEPTRIVGPLYFVGTKSLGAFLFATSEGHILMNTGMPSSGPMIVESIRKLWLNPGNIKIMINGHAHIDHAGAFAYFKEQFGAQMAVMKDDVAAMESGDMGDFKYANDLVYPAVKVDRVLRDGDTINMHDVLAEGVDAWIDREGYRRFIAGKKRAFEDHVDKEMGASRQSE
jgi:metallo-beta-lactamase class B